MSRAPATALAVTLALAGLSAHRQAPAVTLSIVGTNDLHGGIAAEDGRGGLALFNGYIKNLRAARARDGGAVLLIDAGDMWQGTLESNLGEGAPVIAAYNVLGYTAAAIGNHEFDFGPVGPAPIPTISADDPRGALKARASEAAFPFLAANLIDQSTGRSVEWRNVMPSSLVDAAGVKVGIIGVMTGGALVETIAANTHGLQVAPLAEVVAEQARRLRADEATVVIVTAHAGGRCARFDEPRDLSSCDASAEIFEVARRLPPGTVDVIVAGHTHAGVAHEVAGIAISEAFAGGQAFGRVDLTVDRTSGRVRQRRMFRPRDICARANLRTLRCDPFGATSQYEGADVVPDPRVEQILAPALRAAEAAKAAPLNIHLERPLRRGDDAHRSPLGQLFVDAMRQSTGADIAIHNTRGGLRADLPAGPLVYGSVYRTMPFDNRVVSLRLRASELARVLAAELQTSSPRLSISGARVQARCRNGALTVTLLGASAQPIPDSAMLDIVTSDYLALGGNGILSSIMPPDGFAMSGAGPLLRDVVADWLRSRSGPLGEEQFLDRNRWVYPGDLPITCSR